MATRKATTTTKKEKAKKQITLYFESKDDCLEACDLLELSRRKCADIDRTHGGDYSKKSGHYAMVFRGGATRRVNLRAKLSFDEEMFLGLPDEKRSQLKHRETTNIGWVVG